MTEPIPTALLDGVRELDGAALVATGRGLAGSVSVGRCAFLDAVGDPCEAAYKRRCMAAGRVMMHAQIGYRDLDKSRRAWAGIHRALSDAGYPLDRYGICLDWSMGYPAAERARFGAGTGLILDGPADFVALTMEAPVAPHFGDFVIGTPAAVENTTFALMAAQPVECLVHSNLDDGFAALFTDLACSLGAVLIEKHIVEDLIGGTVFHCYGNTFADPRLRLVFLRALAEVSDNPGTMVYGATTLYGEDEARNWGALAAYITTDAIGQRTTTTGHALNPVPVTEARRIPDIDEVIAAHMAANRAIEGIDDLPVRVDHAALAADAERIVAGGTRFRDAVLAGLADAGIDVDDPAQLLLAIRRIGAKRLEERFGPGPTDATARRGRRPLVAAPGIAALERDGRERVGALDAAVRERLKGLDATGISIATDVHEYGKILIDSTLAAAGVTVVDGGTHGEIDRLVALVREHDAAFIAISTYNGVALRYLSALQDALASAALEPVVFVGGRLNEIPAGSNTSLPVDVSARLAEIGVITCATPEDMLHHLAQGAGDRKREGTPS